MSEVVQHLRQVMLQHDGAGLTDGQLLGCFVDQQDEAAVAALVRRHGPMVWGVCRRILRNHHDAEDAFQATFLVFVRRAAVIAPREMVGNWLYGVAYQTALKARAMLAKRRTREKQVPTLPEIEGEEPHLGHDLQAVLDQELSRLPNKYRVAIVLCDLEGKTRIEAARQLGVPPGTLASRLTRGRALLAKRLARHGLAVSAGMLAAELSEQGASASLISSTIKAVTSVAAGQAATTGMISAQAVALAEGMVKTMMLTKLKIATGIVLALTVSAASGWYYQSQPLLRVQEAPPVEQKKEDELRAAAIKAVEQFGKSEQANDREAAIKALMDYRKEVKAAEETRQRHLENATRDLARRFKYRVPFEIGATEFKDGCRIEILEVWGTRPQITGFGQYLVRGKYTLASHKRGELSFLQTAKNLLAMNHPTLDLQHTNVREGQGEFTLMNGMLVDVYRGSAVRGPEELTEYFHLCLSDGTKILADVYFGTGDNVLRKKKK
jgi:RNA polymerase sigma factor (sigma-70 family)